MFDPTLFDYSMIKGTVDAILFQNSDNFYTVLKVDTIETNESFDSMPTVVGFLPNVVEGNVYTFKGQVVEHPRYGKQLKAETFEKELPQTKDAIISYLSSGLFKGIGKKTAQNIVNALGEHAINDILSHPEVLENVPSLSKKKQQQIAEQISAIQESEKIMIRLHGLGFGPKLSMAIYQFYMGETLNVLDENPYQLVYDIKGIGFNKADQLARNIGIAANSPERLKAGLLYTLEEECIKQGHTYLPDSYVIDTTREMLNSENNEEVISDDILLKMIESLSQEKKLISSNEQVSIPSLYYSELKSVQNLYRIKTNTNKFKKIEQSDLQIHIGEIESKNHVNYATSQKEALETAMNSKVMLLTGGPGTGKTTVIKGIVELYAEIHGLSLNYDDYNEDDYPVALAAPTGRASKRLQESTGLEAMTIHRLIGWNQDTQPQDILDNEINARLIIIDEMSMVDTWLFHQFLSVVPLDAQIIFVGDEDQLPSVGPGQVFKDLIDSKTISRVNLTEVYRQQDGSSIIDLAHRMKMGEPIDITQRYHDRSFIDCSANQIPEVVDKVVKSAVKKGYNMSDIQVLAPMYKGNSGIKRLNQVLQSILNPKQDDSREIEFGDVVFRKGDKVLQLVNRPNDNIFNGDIGVIVGIFWAKENALNKDVIVVDFEGNEITFTRQDLLELTHAYCTSIHKAQGSEFPIVIMPIVKQYFKMLQRPIIYTGLTRAKQSLVLLGETQAFDIGLKTNGQQRLTHLNHLLTSYFGNHNYQNTDSNNSTNSYNDEFGKEDQYTLTEMQTDVQLSESTIYQIDPMINMGEITPYDFRER
ncbi:ATP-dependent RecD-like DNA helicase [Staphylococcus saccharolyticus]|uniref:SF1B family DNA helicase RecD2 n=1 Tax=Staphylococcus saccharolyticus TaxID=33028 RepID=UPI00102DA55E|nr:ATP-dependent RecD-like DNA helicase [Staphylococcus saccharolyticus]MBL7573351.1 ATP-dependent RecD-like DNA helicase [Staphylococcus saccharolyticus]MBL7583714.1 ATP-dependent RecD-like DNA helicase [Staphylococcus saccharolyticus]MBL7638969.1 ATP-dependent RecD-like DNA helicase [Staphylococcus saccharolyticus]QRJ69177.1 ATP-dependent RecD-like DNA helicase [Staphylococcus saccharolyticus]TAA93878.1 ATP-dependent RecD-like DNA helicase [Staphylococcus saccharolyticus]